MQNIKFYRALTAAAVVFIIDRLIKNTALFGRTAGGDWWEVGQVKNTSAVFSWPMTNNLVILISGGVLVGLIIYMYYKHACLNNWCINGEWLIIMGGLSNLIDRIFYGGVVDVMRLGQGWFNLADVVIILGVSSIIFSYSKLYGR